ASVSQVQQTHPTPEQLRAFALGRLGPEEAAELERHVASCDSCCAELNRVPDDSLLGRLRAGQTTPGMAAADTFAARQLPARLAGHARYRVLRRLGEGGMGVVYHAVHKLMEREVALKVIHTSLTRNPSAVKRLHQEVKAAARLHHPNIVTAHDAEQVGELHF